MKRVLPLIICLQAISFYAQTSVKLFEDHSTVQIVPNATIDITTTPQLVSTHIIDLVNTSSVLVHSYDVKRYDMVLNTISTEDFAIANFCFAGSCYPDITMLSQNSLTLNPLQNSNTVGTGTDTAFFSLYIDLTEAKSMGFSLVKYTIYNTNNHADSVQITARYNKNLFGLGFQNSILHPDDFKLLPNPVENTLFVRSSSFVGGSSRLKISDVLGREVLNSPLDAISRKESVAIDISSLPSGLYYAEVSTDSSVNRVPFYKR